MLGWLRERGVQARELDITTPGGLGEAAWIDAADCEVVPVLILRDDARELVRYVGHLPQPRELRRVIALTDEESR